MLLFHKTAFSNVPILSGGQVSTVQSIILSGAGVGQGQNICFTITIFKAISGTGSTVYSDCCHTDTICVVSPVCGEQLGSICGMKFSDDNGNGSQDTGELGLAGWTISLTSYNLLGAATTVTAITDATGAYCFTNLAADTYTIKETQNKRLDANIPCRDRYLFHNPYSRCENRKPKLRKPANTDQYTLRIFMQYRL